MTGFANVIAAKARAEAARKRLTETASELQARLKPKALVHNVWADAVDRSADAWETAMDRSSEALSLVVDKGSQAKDDAVAFARERPGVATAAVTAAVALLVGPFLVRRALRTDPDLADPPHPTGPIPHLETRP